MAVSLRLQNHSVGQMVGLIDGIEGLHHLLADEQAFAKAGQALHQTMVRLGEPGQRAVAILLDHPNPDVVASALYVLGKAWSVANYRKLIALTRQHPDHLALHHILLPSIFTALALTSDPVIRDFMIEYPLRSPEHGVLLWVVQQEESGYQREERLQ